jgi:hypothetical protein
MTGKLLIVGIIAGRLRVPTWPLCPLARALSHFVPDRGWTVTLVLIGR